jgi:hypothetical protein
MAYGYEVRDPNDRKVDASKNLLQLVSKIGAPGSLLVNELPFCEYSPPLSIRQVRRLFNIHISEIHP